MNTTKLDADTEHARNPSAGASALPADRRSSVEVTLPPTIEAALSLVAETRGVTAQLLRNEITFLRRIVEAHPAWGTPNYCHTCSPRGLASCRCEIACNE